jgi:SAM-dependent methyltransferase
MPSHYGNEYHDSVSEAGEKDAWQRWAYPRRRILEFIQEGSLLDIGCSSGGFLKTLRGSSFRLHGIEVAFEEAQKAMKSTGAQVFVGEIRDAPFPPSSFDVITGFHVLEHMVNPRETINILWKWLKPGGILCLHVPNIQAMEARIFGSYWYGLELPRHLSHFSPSSLRKLLGHFAFDELCVKTIADNYIERSSQYLLGQVKRKFGFATAPTFVRKQQPCLPWKITRKLARVSLLAPFSLLASVAGRGATIEAIYRKCA